MNAWVDVAVVTGTKTLDGRLVVRKRPGLPFLLRENMTVYFVPPVLDAPRTASVIELEENAGEDYIARFSGIADRTCAACLQGCHILVDREALDEIEAQIADDQLIGYDVIDEVYGFLGTAYGLDEMPGQYLLAVEREEADAELLIPFVDEFILDVDPENRVICTCVPAGLLSL